MEKEMKKKRKEFGEMEIKRREWSGGLCVFFYIFYVITFVDFKNYVD